MDVVAIAMGGVALVLVGLVQFILHRKMRRTQLEMELLQDELEQLLPPSEKEEENE